MKSRIVIVGAGFGGLSAAKALCRDPHVQITLIDERNYYLFLPLLYQVAVGTLSPNDIAMPIRTFFSRYPNVQVLQERVVSVDLKNQQVATGACSIGYDHLIMACGARLILSKGWRFYHE